jgi:CTP:phosphocholine cytidylyltransferase-like protein
VKGKNKFSASDAGKIRALIEKKYFAAPSEQKLIRDEIRKLGFYIEDFSAKKGYTIEDFNRYVSIVG